MTAKDPTSRFFVALRPDGESAGRLASMAARLAEGCRARALAAADLHLTLAFIGARPRTDCARLLALLRGLPPRVPGFTLDAIGRFGPALLWAGPSRGSTSLAPLAASIRQRLEAGDVDFDRRPLHPHRTLLRTPREREAGRAAIGPCPPVEVREWRLALGGSHPAPTPGQRYQWHEPGA